MAIISLWIVLILACMVRCTKGLVKDLEIQKEKETEKIYGEVHDFTSQGGRLDNDVL